MIAAACTNLAGSSAWFERGFVSYSNVSKTELLGVDPALIECCGAVSEDQAGITGGRNMADEYFDYNRAYNFRDRDMLVLGPVVGEMEASFSRFWESGLAVPVEKLLAREMKS